MSTVRQVTGVAGAVLVIVAAGGSAPATGAGRVAPPLPVVRVHRAGDHLIVRYRFRSWPSDPRRHPATLLVSSQSAGTRYPPLTQSYRVKRRSGRITHPVGLGSAPFTLLYSVYSTSGIRSATRRIPLS